MDELTIGTIGTIAGIFGLGIAVVSYYKQIQLEKRFAEKERLISLANKLKDLIDLVEWQYLHIFEKPSAEDDEYFNLNSLSRSVISSSFDEKMPTISVAIEVSVHKNDISENKVACHNCCEISVALYPDSTHSSKDKYLLPVIQSSLISIMMQTATLRSA